MAFNLRLQKRVRIQTSKCSSLQQWRMLSLLWKELSLKKQNSCFKCSRLTFRSSRTNLLSKNKLLRIMLTELLKSLPKKSEPKMSNLKLWLKDSAKSLKTSNFLKSTAIASKKSIWPTRQMQAHKPVSHYILILK